jgi:hypothetical protein
VRHFGLEPGGRAYKTRKESGSKTNDLKADTILNEFKISDKANSDRNIK